MKYRTMTARARFLPFVAAVAMALVLAGGIAPRTARAAGPVDFTLDQETGGQLTRFTLQTTTGASETISAFKVTFPAGFDLTKEHADVVTLAGLNRVPVKYTTTISGQSVVVTFAPPLASSTDLRITMNDVFTPHAGGKFSAGVSYETSAATKVVPGVTFTYATPTMGQDIAMYLDGQKWVQAWNSVNILNLFLQPQYAVLSFTTVWAGWLISLALVVLAFPLAIIGGLLLAFMKMSKIPPVRWIASAYINVVRGTPLFLQITIAFVGLPIAGVHVQWFVSGVIVLALNSSAYLAEIFRAGIQSINKGQFEAASSLGMTYPQSMGYVIVPQTVKRVLPTMTSEFILLFKDTALLSAFGVFELMLYSNNLVARSGNITPFMVAAVYYLVVTVPLINVVGRLEAKLAQSEGGQTPVKPSKRGRTWMPAAAGPAESLEASSVEHESR